MSLSNCLENLRKTVVGMLVLGFACVSASQASAQSLQLRIVAGPVTVLVQDNLYPDGHPALGAITWSGSVGGYQLIVATALSKPNIGGPNNAAVDLNVLVLQAESNPITITATDTGFSGPVNGSATLTSHIGGTTANPPSPTVQAYLDSSNAPFGISGTSVCTTGSQPAVTPSGTGFNSTLTANCPVSGLFSLTLSATGVLAKGQQMGFDFFVGATTPNCGAIGDVVWHDLNRDGIQDPGEPGIDGVTVRLKNAGGVVIATTTTGVGPSNQHGYYQFSGACGGIYTVEVVTPPGFAPTTSTAPGSTSDNDSNGSPAPVILPNGASDQTIDFGFVTPCTGTIGDFVWQDLNRDGIQDPGEPGINGVTVTLKGPGGTVIATTTTGVGPGGQGGYYQFAGLCGGNYTVEVVTPPGLAPTTPNASGSTPADDSNGSPASVSLVGDNDSDQTIDFGFVSPCTGTLGDFVWHDLDHDGIQDPGEPGIDGVTVTLKNSGGTVIATTTTGPGPSGQQGYYQFSGLCGGTYTVLVATPAGFTPTTPFAPGSTPADDSNGSPVVVTLPNGASDQTIDFGFVSPCTGTIGDFVWEDLNANGVQGGAEPGINGVTVKLHRASDYSVIATTFTANGGSPATDGYYQFTGLCAGEYKVELVPLPGYAMSPTGQGTPATDSNANPSLVVLADDNASDQTIDFGIYQPVPKIKIIKRTNGTDNDSPTGPFVPIPSTVTWTYTVTNTGNEPIANVQVKDDNGTPLNAGDDFFATYVNGDSNGNTLLDLTEIWTFTASGPALVGQYENFGTATGKGNISNTPVTDKNVDHYFGSNQASCDVTLTKQCAIVPPPPAQSFVCADAKPIDSLTMIWQGPQAQVHIKAYKGAIGSTLLYNSATAGNPISIGEEVTVTGFSGAPNDVVWEVFNVVNNTTLGTKIGASDFHLSCSDIDMNDPTDCGKTQGDAKGLTGFLNQWTFDGMAGNGQVLDCSPSTTLNWQDSCEIVPQENPSCSTEGKPTSLTFKYVPADCSVTNNPQGGKYLCSGTTPSGAVALSSTTSGLTFSPSSVAPGQEFTVTGTFGTQTVFKVGTQSISIHTSCSQLLEVGNIFASMQLVGFNGDRGGAQVKYRYVVTNNSNGMLNYSVIDTVGGNVVNQYTNQSLAAGAMHTFDNFIATLNATTTNTATVFGTVGVPPNQSCQATDSVTVSVPPTPPCSLTTGALATSSKQLTWPVTNGGTSKVTVSDLVVTWPASNGYLSKVKLDGDVLWDGTINCSGGLCWASLNTSDLTTDAKKKSIDPGKTRTLIFEFQNNANTNLSLYSVAVNFGDGCKISYPNLPPCSGSLNVGNYVWFDANNNGIQDATEQGVNDVTVTLKALDGTVVATTTTANNAGTKGYYQFSGLCNDRFYMVEMTPPAGYSSAASNAPGSTSANDSNPNPAVIKLVSGSDQTIDFGLIDGVNYCADPAVSGLTGPSGTLFAKALTAGATAPAGTPFAGQTFGKDVVIVRFDQSFAVNDNTYGTGSSWGHTFGNLVGSDMAQFAIYNQAGTKTLEFKIDTISASAGAPSGYASLGVLGGEGAVLAGSAAWVVDATTALDANLNDHGYCTGGATGTCKTTLLVNSGPSANVPAKPLFSLINAFYAVIDASAFGGLANFTDPASQVLLVAQHNSPQKVGSFTSSVCK